MKQNIVICGAGRVGMSITEHLSNEEKKIIYRQSFKDTNDKLSAIFSKEEIKSINSLLKEQNKKAKN